MKLKNFPYFVEPLPDEDIHSCIQRTALMLNFPVYSFMKEILNTKTPNMELRLYDFSDIYEAYSRTTLPWRLINYSKRKKERLIAKIVYDRKALRIQTQKHAHFRYCPECLLEDKKRFGIPYYYSFHQISCVDLCPKHGCNILATKNIYNEESISIVRNNLEIIEDLKTYYNLKDQCLDNLLSVYYSGFLKLGIMNDEGIFFMNQFKDFLLDNIHGLEKHFDYRLLNRPTFSTLFSSAINPLIHSRILRVLEIESIPNTIAFPTEKLKSKIQRTPKGSSLLHAEDKLFIYSEKIEIQDSNPLITLKKKRKFKETDKKHFIEKRREEIICKLRRSKERITYKNILEAFGIKDFTPLEEILTITGDLTNLIESDLDYKIRLYLIDPDHSKLTNWKITLLDKLTKTYKEVHHEKM